MRVEEEPGSLYRSVREGICIVACYVIEASGIAVWNPQSVFMQSYCRRCTFCTKNASSIAALQKWTPHRCWSWQRNPLE